MLYDGEEEGAGLTVCLSLLLLPGSGAAGSLAADESPPLLSDASEPGPLPPGHAPGHRVQPSTDLK